MGPVRLYHVTVNGRRTRMKLNDADAERMGAVPVYSNPAPKQQAATEPAPAAEKPPVKKRTARNKARTATTKATSDEPAEE